MDKYPITSKGLAAAQEEIKRLKSEDRPTVITAIAIAREHGDLKENAEYHAARDKQSFIEGRIAMIDDLIAKAQAIDVSSMSGTIVKFGATVVLADEGNKEVKYQIVGEYEAKIEEGLISFSSPVSRALIGKEEGDFVEVKAPGGIKEYEIIKVEYV